jgi:hypothetical protein
MKMQAERKFIVLKAPTCDTLPLDDRSFLMDLRRALLQQLTVIEKKLGLSRKCRQCGHALSGD